MYLKLTVGISPLELAKKFHSQRYYLELLYFQYKQF